MSKIGTVLAELHRAETGLAEAFRRVAGRHAADSGTHYPCRTLAQQCDQRARRVRDLARRHDGEFPEPHRSEAADALSAAARSLRRTFSELLGDRPFPGLLLLHDLRRLNLKAQAVELQWTLLGQAAQTVRDKELLNEVVTLHAQALTQIKWTRTRLKEAAPQALASRE